MEIRRSFLLVAIAIVGYLMFLNWQQEFGEGKKANQVAAQQAPTAPSNEVDSFPTEADVAKPTTSDTPEIAVETNTQSSEQKPQPTIITSQYITVETDVMDLLIDPQGGDVVSAKLKDYPIDSEDPDIPFQLLGNNPQGIELILQSGLIGKNGTDTGASRPVYFAEKSSYQLEKNKNELVVELTLQQSDVLITKRYTFTKGSYLVAIDNLVQNNGNQDWSGAFYGQIKRDNSIDPSLGGKGFTNLATYLGGAYLSADDKYEKLKFDDIKGTNFKVEREGGWIALSQHYFLTAWLGNETQKNAYSAISKTGTGDKDFYFFRYISPVQVAKPGALINFESSVYVGPKVQRDLEAVNPSLARTIDYGWSWFIAKPIFSVLVFLQSGEFSLFGKHYDLGTGVKNWGFAIILLTVIIKLLFFRLSASAYRSMAKMRKVAPEMKRIKEQYKDDRQKQSQAMMKLYKKEQINPIGGCLPMIIQAPVFIALYYVLLYAVELRQAPFMGWVQDLSVMDPYFILPVLMGAAMFFQMQLNPAPADPMQAKIMKWMPVGFTFFFLWFPAGLVLYYVTNNLLSIAQQYVITRNIEKGDAPAIEKK